MDKGAAAAPERLNNKKEDAQVLHELNMLSQMLNMEKYFSTPLDNIQKKSIFARLKILDYYP